MLHAYVRAHRHTSGGPCWRSACPNKGVLGRVLRSAVTNPVQAVCGCGAAPVGAGGPERADDGRLPRRLPQPDEAEGGSEGGEGPGEIRVHSWLSDDVMALQVGWQGKKVDWSVGLMWQWEMVDLSIWVEVVVVVVVAVVVVFQRVGDLQGGALSTSRASDPSRQNQDPTSM